MRTITIGPNDAGQRLDKFMQKLIPDMPKGLLYKLIRKKRIKYNGARCKGMEQLQSGDTLSLYISDDFFPAAKKPDFHNVAGRPDIVYEDSNILIVYKPVGMFAHSGNQKNAVCLIDEIQKYLYDKGEYHPELEQTFSPALCNRIDRNTEGLVIAAKNAEALRAMNEVIRQRFVDKCYLAVTAAPLPDKQATLTAYLKKDSSQNKVRVSDTKPDDSWQEIRTQYRVLARDDRHDLVYIRLLTGRTHQIRAHLAHLGAPLLGDPKYGGNSRSEENQCLCAYSLKFSEVPFPVLSALNGKEFAVPLPSFVQSHFPEMTAEKLISLLA
ncbi:MAG: RluA family pseudouridine synthase [Oscillospiraceae bacterium]|nr:RluA family pseudouridine synthase [Oscillospiraceae bacterium]